jgi:hypothetical protein
MTGAEISRVSVNSKRSNSVSGQENTGLVFGRGDAFFASSLPFLRFPVLLMVVSWMVRQ